MTVLSPPYVLGAAGQVIPGRTLRTSLGAVFMPGAGVAAVAGVLAGPANTMGELALPSPTQLTVQPFRAVVQNTEDLTAGQYVVTNDAAVTLAVTAQAATQFRRSLIVIEVNDSQTAGVASSATTDRVRLHILDGALAASSEAAALPGVLANSLALGELLIPPTGQTVTLSPYRPRTTIRGGVLPLPTEAAVLALPTARLWPGFRAFAEDTAAEAVWDGAGWAWYDTRWQTYTPTVSVTNAPPFAEITYGSATRIGRYRRAGRQVHLNVMFRLGTGTSYAGLNGPIRIGYPTNLMPSAANNPQAGIGNASGAAFVAHAGGSAVGAVYHEQYNTDPATFRMYFLYPTNTAALAGGSSPTWNLTTAGNYVQFTTSYEIA